MAETRIRVAPNTVAYADGEKNRLVVEFAIPGAPTDTVDLKLLPDSVHLTAPAKDIEYVAALALAWPVKPDKAQAVYENGMLRIEVPFKDPMEDAVKVRRHRRWPEHQDQEDRLANDHPTGLQGPWLPRTRP